MPPLASREPRLVWMPCNFHKEDIYKDRPRSEEGAGLLLCQESLFFNKTDLI